VFDSGKKLDYTNDEPAIGLGNANLGLGFGEGIEFMVFSAYTLRGYKLRFLKRSGL
jgi:hypothetical protein